MFYTYVLKEIDKEHFYVGSANNLKRRFFQHQEGESKFTQGRKWRVYCYFAFQHEEMARKFEKYLKSGSGRAFSKKHFSF